MSLPVQTRPLPLRVYMALLIPLILGGILPSCTTVTPDHSMVSNGWLQTQPRKAEYPARDAGGIAHWDTSLPPAQGQPPQQGQPSASAPRTDAVFSQPAQERGQPVRYPPYYGHSWLAGHKPIRHRVSRQPSYFANQQKVGQNYQRSVETIGPAMVPRGNVPLVDWSADIDAHRGQ